MRGGHGPTKVARPSLGVWPFYLPSFTAPFKGRRRNGLVHTDYTSTVNHPNLGDHNFIPVSQSHLCSTLWLIKWQLSLRVKGFQAVILTGNKLNCRLKGRSWIASLRLSLLALHVYIQTSQEHAEQHVTALPTIRTCVYSSKGKAWLMSMATMHQLILTHVTG